MVDEIAKDAQQAQVKMPMKPWLPPLPESLVGPELDWQTAWQQPRQLKVPFGMLDIPSRQTQEKFEFDVAVLNPALIIGSAGYGKSIALQTIVTNLARLNNPEQVHFYLLDFGTNGLLPLVGLPHVADIAGFDDLEKLHKMLKRLVNLLEQRRNQFQTKGVSNLQQYESLTGETLPAIVVVLDAYDTVVENEVERIEIDLVLSRLLREGQALGIYTIISANRYTSFRASMTSNITSELLLYMVEENAPRDILGRKVLKQSPIPGRGQMEIDDEMLAFQIYTPTEHAESLKIVHDLRELSKFMTDDWDGEVPAKIPMLPARFNLDYLENNESINKWWQVSTIPLGFDKENTLPVGFMPDEHHHFMISYFTTDQAETIARDILFSLSKIECQTGLIDVNGEYQNYARLVDKDYRDDVDSVKKIIPSICGSG